MYNLQKTIRYGFWLILEVIALCVGMIYNARTVRAEPEVQQPARKVKEGISLRIPASVAQSWKVAENGTIQALVQKVSNHSYEIKIYKGTQKITDIPGSRIMIPVKAMFPNGGPETMEITDSRGRKLKTFLDKKQDLLIVDTDETGIFCVRGRKIDDIEENPFAVAVLTTATMITVLIVGIRSRSGKRGDSHKGEK